SLRRSARARGGSCASAFRRQVDEIDNGRPDGTRGAEGRAPRLAVVPEDAVVVRRRGGLQPEGSRPRRGRARVAPLPDAEARLLVSPGAPARVLMLTTSSYPHDVRIYHEVSALLAAGHEVTVVCSAVSSTSSEEADPGVRVYRFQNPFLRTHNARVTTTESTPRQGARLKPLGVAGYALGWGGSTVAAFVQSLRALRTPGFDVVHVHNPPDTLAIVAALYRPFGKRLVFDHHDLTAEMYMARARGQGNPLVYRVLLVL